MKTNKINFHIRSTIHIFQNNFVLIFVAVSMLFLYSCTTNKYYYTDSFGYTNSPTLVKKTVKTTTTTYHPVDTSYTFYNDQNYIEENFTDESYESGIFQSNIFENTGTTHTETIINNYYSVDPYSNNYNT
jgi:predicted small secreted protein